MNQLNHVLVAVDFSEPARAAFAHALALARLHDAELLVVHAVPTDRPFSWHARERLALVDTLRHAATTGGVRFKVSVQHGDPAGVILLHATARRADLIVLGASTRSGLDRLRVGSVAETVALKATQPVLAVPSTSATIDDSVACFNSIVVAVGLNHGSAVAVEHALSIANEKSRVTLVHVVPGVPLAGAHRYMYGLMEREYQRQLARDAWRRLPEIVPAGVRASRTLHVRVVTGDPSTEILRVAADVDADVILIGVASRGAFGRMFFRSTAARVLRSAGRPVLALPQLLRQTVVPVSDKDRFAAAA